MALQADGWYVRSTVIWHKPNPMPESVRDRPTKAHEYLFMLAKRGKYYYDAEAVAEPIASGTAARYAYGFNETAKSAALTDTGHWHRGKNGRDNLRGDRQLTGRRNRRTVWTCATKPFSARALGFTDVDHFAAYPPALIEPCVLAGTSAAGCCPACAAPWRRVVERRKCDHPASGETNRAPRPDGWTNQRRVNIPGHGTCLPRDAIQTTGWEPSCACNAGAPVPCTVLDPFSGAGTTGLVALKHGRRYLGIDLNPAYHEIARARLAAGAAPGRKAAA